MTLAPRNLKKSFLSYIWDNDTHLKSKAELRLLFKLDCSILITVCFGYWMKYIDQANLSNAYVTGMKEALDLNKNQYTYMGTCYNVALTVMTIPGALIVTRVRPSYWLPFCEIGWAVFTFAQAGAKNATHMYVFRTMIGLFEASFAPVAVFMLGSWYTPAELGKRVAIWFITGPAGLAFSGFLQAAIASTLDGKAGLQGWQWLYIICGIMTVPCGVALFFFLPDFPENTKVWFISEDERQLAIARCARAGTAATTGKFDKALAKKIFTSWRIWVIVPTYVIFACSVQDVNYFAIWAKSAGFSVSDRNILSSVAFLIAIPCALFYGFMSDLTGNRWAWMCGPLVVSWIPLGIIAVWPDGRLLKKMAFIFSDIVLVTHIFYAYVNEMCKDNAQERAFVIGAINAVFYAVNAWLPILIFPQTMAPSQRRGFPATFAFAIIAVFMIYGMHLMHKRELRNAASTIHRQDTEIGIVDRDYDSEKAEIVPTVAGVIAT